MARDVARSVGAVILPFQSSVRRSRPTLNRTVQAHIAFALRQMYNDLLDQPIPERFIELLTDVGCKQSERA